MDPTCAVGRLGVKQACMGPRQRYRLAPSEVVKRKERSFYLKCDKLSRPHTTVGLFDLQKLLNLVIKLLFVLHGFSTATSSIKILLFDLPKFKPWFQNSFDIFETTYRGSFQVWVLGFLDKILRGLFESEIIFAESSIRTLL